jgi:hypothetical protein
LLFLVELSIELHDDGPLVFLVATEVDGSGGLGGGFGPVLRLLGLLALSRGFAAGFGRWSFLTHLLLFDLGMDGRRLAGDLESLLDLVLQVFKIFFSNFTAL